MQITRRLLREKLRRQGELLAGELAEMPNSNSAAQGISEALIELEAAETPWQLRLAEARAASAYWSVWSGLQIRFARRDEGKVPAHWRAFGVRTSPLTSSPRQAVDPANALLNYAYAVVESEASIAARAVGLDPGLGILHADQPNRDSLADDLMEPVRPLVDRFVVRMLAARRFAKADFHETRQGVCRITPRLAREVAEAAQALRPVVGAVAEDVARMLDEGSPAISTRLATPLSGRNRSAGRNPKARHAQGSKEPRVSAACTTCGGPVPTGRRTCSDACEAEGRVDARAAFGEAGTAALRELRASGWTPEISAAGRRRIATRASTLVEAARAWQREHPWPEDMGLFEREILPRLVDVPVRHLAEVTGLSESYCRRVKRGLMVPHPMWWDAMASGQ
jgi:hypothetical protein